MNPNWKRLRNGEIGWDLFRTRSEIIRLIRRFFDDRGYTEIEPPLLSPYPTLDDNIRSIPAQVSYPDDRILTHYLHTSPEHAMKKLIAAGLSRIYFLGKVFRDGEMTRLHNPEYTHLEWYRSPCDYHGIREETEELIRTVAATCPGKNSIFYMGESVSLSPPWPSIPLRSLVLDKTGIDLEEVPDQARMLEAVRKTGVTCSEEDDWETLFFRLYLDKVERGLGFPRPLFIVEYPPRLGLMARRMPDSEWVERVELYMGGMEIANGYGELLDAEELKDRFLADSSKKRSRKEPSRIDEELIEALKEHIPPTAGMALGVDRLVMLLTGKSRIDEVILFPHHFWASG